MIKADFSGAVILPPGGRIPTGPTGRRLKKYCPCEGCQKWRAERALMKQAEKMKAEFHKAMSQCVVFRTPITEADIERPPIPLGEFGSNRAATPVSIGRFSSSEPQNQSLPKEYPLPGGFSLMIGGTK